MAGNDQIQASSLNSQGNTVLSNTVLRRWVASNRAPSVSAGGPYLVDEGGSVQLGALAQDLDDDEVLITWDLDNDGTFETSGPAPIFSAVALDGATTHTIRVQGDDGNGHLVVSTGTIEILNVAPMAVLNAPATVAEGETITVALRDPSDPSIADTSAGFLYAFDLGSGFGTFGAGNSVQLATVDNGQVSVKAKIRDKDGGETEYVTFITVTNVAPTASISGPASAVPGQLRAFSGSFSDPGLADTQTTDWQIIDPANGLVSSGSGASIDFTPQHPGSYTVRFTVTDDDGGVGIAEHSLLVSMFDIQPDPCDPELTALVVGGTSAGDHILFTPGAAAGDIVATVNGVVLGTFQPSGRIMAYGLAGDDNLQVAGSIVLSAWLYGQAGDDRLKGGAGDDVILGGTGDDLIVGGSGRDVQIGGADADRIVGNAEDDILIAGMTRHDDDVDALCAIVDEWTSVRSYEQRIANLNGIGTGAEFAARLNGSVFLTSGPTADEATLVDDQAEDILTGSSGLDWFLLSSHQDRVTDLKDELFADDLAYILS
jgi:Ca2+-binding RTX toxin-like protein